MVDHELGETLVVLGTLADMAKSMNATIGHRRSVAGPSCGATPIVSTAVADGVSGLASAHPARGVILLEDRGEHVCQLRYRPADWT